MISATLLLVACGMRLRLCLQDPLRELAALEALSDPGHPNVLRKVEVLDDGASYLFVFPLGPTGWLSPPVPGCCSSCSCTRVRMLGISYPRRQRAGRELVDKTAICHRVPSPDQLAWLSSSGRPQPRCPASDASAVYFLLCSSSGGVLIVRPRWCLGRFRGTGSGCHPVICTSITFGATGVFVTNVVFEFRVPHHSVSYLYPRLE